MNIVQKHTENSKCLMKISGVLDYSTIDACNEKICDIPELVTEVLVDFSDLEFIDSTGIGAIINLLYLAKDRHMVIDFCGLHDEIAELFETIGVFKIMEALKEGKHNHVSQKPIGNE